MSDTEDAQGQEVTYFTNADGKKIACRYWLPKIEPKALVFISHGVGEHCGCYQKLATALSDHGFKVCGQDHLGHGLSEGDRVHINSFGQYVRDVVQHVEIVSENHKGLDRFLLGHSMGGAVAIELVMAHSEIFKGMMLIGPAIVPNPETATDCMVCMAKLLASIWPQAPVAAVDTKLICRDPEVVEAYENDPLVYHGKLKAKWGLEMLKTMTHITNNPEKITTPMIVHHGTDDKLAEVEGARFLQDTAASTDKDVKIIEHAYHQVHNEPEGVGTQCIQEICDWVVARS